MLESRIKKIEKALGTEEKDDDVIPVLDWETMS